MINPDPFIQAVEQFGSMGVIITSLEWLARHRELKDDGLMSWMIYKHTRPRLAVGLLARILDVVLAYPRVLVVVCARCIAAALLLSGILEGAPRGRADAIVAGTSVALWVRCSFGHDGSDQMSSIVFVTLSLARLVHDPIVKVAGLWFIAFQACLSYVAAGVAKAISPKWRSGEYLPRILTTTIYGHAAVGGWLGRHPEVSRWVARSVIAFECTFVLVLILPAPWRWILLAIGVLFHLTNAIVLGLNTFLWAFIATYPAIVYCATMLVSWVG